LARKDILLLELKTLSHRKGPIDIFVGLVVLEQVGK